jgi:transcriptional regulator with XRE-family HTH domain
MAKAARGTIGTTAPDTRPTTREPIEVLRRGRQGEARRPHALSVVPLPRRAREADDGRSTMLARALRSKSRPQDVDRHVGVRVRDRRILLGMTQQQLAELIGVTFQQAHKYEKGTNRVTAGRLYTIARALGVDISYFYEGLANKGSAAPSPRQRLLLELARNFLAIRDRRHQGAVVSLARALAENEGGNQLTA